MIKIINARLYTGKVSYENAAILIDGSKIAYAGPAANCPEIKGGCRLIDAKNGIVAPSFFNAHAHNAMTILRGVGSDLNLMDWLGKVMPIEDGLVPEDVYWGTTLACGELLRRGCTAFADMYYFMDEVARAALDAGMRANISRGCTNFDGIDSETALYENWHDKGDGLINVYMGLHAEYTTNPEVVRYAVEAAGKLKTGFHVHGSESTSEVQGCFDRHGCSPVEYFRRFGTYENPTIMAHCVHVSDEDIAILANNHVSVATNPASNLKLANGVAPVARMRKAGVRVALGTDGPSSNNTLDMMADMRLMALLQKGINQDPLLLPAAEAIEIATREGALALGFEDCGLIEAGMRADLFMLDADAENLQPAEDIPATLVYAAQGLNVRMTMCNGRILYEDGKFTTIDMPEAIKRVSAAKTRLTK